jgi:predicted acylesterase/phospholipase RssA
MAAHLALNWDRYCGSEEDFDAVAADLINFVKLDVRNRIVRRFPIASLLNLALRVSRFGPARKFTRAGLLETHYEKFLFGEVPLFQLPQSPQLFVLATDVSEGSLCAFSRDGFLLQRRSKIGKPLGVEHVDMGLATISMAVAASSAFPGFFPPLELTGKEVGSSSGEFERHSFTDGGVFDNLGLRFFRYFQEQKDQQLSRVFVSDAGAPFRVHANGRSGGLLRTALRSSDILMTRVNELELESFANTPEALFLPITRQVTREEDPHALHPELQWQAATMRTDLDRFSDLEISALVQHGYCVARQVTREVEILATTPETPAMPWQPLSLGDVASEVETDLRDETKTLLLAKNLQTSSSRRTFSTLLNWRDWPSYVWISALLLVTLTFPYMLFKARRDAIRQGYVLSALSETSPVYADLLEILNENSSNYVPELAAEKVPELATLDFTGYKVITDDRVYDLRGWSDASNPPPPLMHARFLFRRTPESVDQPTLRIQLPSNTSRMHAEFLPNSLKPKHYMQELGNGNYLFETRMDMSRVPINSETNVVVRQLIPTNMADHGDENGSFKFTIAAETSIARIWVLLPSNRQHTQFRLSRFPINNPQASELVEATTTVSLPIGAIANFELVEPEEGYRYECSWEWGED